MYVPEQGDMVILDFEPSAGNEITKRRPALVLSRRIYNRHTNLSIVAPVTSTVTGMGLEVVLPEGMETEGAVLLVQLKSFDYQERRMKFLEQAPSSVIQEALKKVALIIS